MLIKKALAALRSARRGYQQQAIGQRSPQIGSLREWIGPEGREELLNVITDNGRLIAAPENRPLLNMIRIYNDSPLVQSRIRAFSENSTNPEYVFIIEENDLTMPRFLVRSPVGHGGSIPHDLIREVVSMSPTAAIHKVIEINCDSTVHNTFVDVYGKAKNNDHASMAFIMTDEQIEQLMKTNYDAPPGYYLCELDNEEEFAQCAKEWDYLDHIELFNDRLRNLPTSALRTNDGELAAYITTSTIGTSSHQYTKAGHRGKGLAQIVERNVGKKLIQRGMRPYGHVYVENATMLKLSLRNSAYKVWTDDHGEPIMYNFSYFNVKP